MSIRKLATLLAAASFVVATAACGSSGGTPTAPATPGVPDKVTAEVIPIVDVAPIYLGQKKGFFTEQNIDLTLDTSLNFDELLQSYAEAWSKALNSTE